MSFLNELKRRNVLRVGAAYIVSAWLIVQVAETLFPIYGLTDAAVRMVVNVMAVGLVPVLVLSWVFEWTPEGLKKDQDIDHDRPASIKAAKTLDRMIIIVLVLALGFFAFDKFVLDPARDVEIADTARQEGRSEAIVESYGDQSIAVLAFENMSSDEEQGYFADGIAEEILNLLAQIPELRVISRSSAFTYKGKEVPVPQIASELNVAHVLEGSVRMAGNRIRITAQLIEGRSDTHLWSETYDRVLDDVFAIQDEIAAQVVESLQLALSGSSPKSLRTDPEVYALTLQAKQLMETRQGPESQEAWNLLEKALSLDPNYLPALESLSLLDYFIMSDSLTEEEMDARWATMRDRILALDPDNIAIHSYMAWDLYEKQRDFEAATREYERLVRRNPNDSELLRVAGGFLRRIGIFKPAISLLERCTQLDPLKHTCTWQLKEAFLWAGDFEQARKHSDRLNAIWGRSPTSHDMLIRLSQGQVEEAKAIISDWDQETEHYHAMSALIAYEQGDTEAFNKHMADYLHVEGEDFDDFWHPFTAAQIYAYIGDSDNAFSWLDKAIEADERQVFRELFNPFFRNLHGDPRWGELHKRFGLSEERLEAIEFEVPADWR